MRANSSRARGPSPLARGSPQLGQRRARHRGSIPARAGEPSPTTRRCTRPRVHPRSRGGAGATVATGTGHLGPSPLARGSRLETGDWRLERGSIPARAGEPTRAESQRPAKKVHPRSRGGAQSPVGSTREKGGPSPLARGSHSMNRALLSSLGSIPARAGEPSSRREFQHLGRVHPRSRGGADAQGRRARAWQGPSPLARGSRRSRDPPHQRAGSIPARAGEPSASFMVVAFGGVHPRSRGGAVQTTSTVRCASGPSPLARGSLYRLTH